MKTLWIPVSKQHPAYIAGCPEADSRMLMRRKEDDGYRIIDIVKIETGWKGINYVWRGLKGHYEILNTDQYIMLGTLNCLGEIK